MRGYLLDTNIVSYLWDTRREQHARVAARADALSPTAPLIASAVVLGEIRFGLRFGTRHREYPSAESDFRLFQTTRLPLVFDAGRHTAAYYGDLKARLCEKCAPAGKKSRSSRLNQLIDPMTSDELGVNENDVWIAAQAIEHNLVLVTHDAHMRRLRAVAGDDLALVTEDWTE